VTLKPANKEEESTSRELVLIKDQSLDQVSTSDGIIDLTENKASNEKDMSKALVKLDSLSLKAQDGQIPIGKRKIQSPTPYPSKITIYEEASGARSPRKQEQVPFDEEANSMPEAIAILRSISPVLKTPLLGEYFGRVTIEEALGGNVDNMFCSSVTGKNQEQAYPCPYYVATRVDSNPWEPRYCGEHGCLLHPFSTVHKIEDHLLSTVFSLFLRRGLDTWEYMGEYRQPYPPKRLSTAGQSKLFEGRRTLLNEWARVVANASESDTTRQFKASYSKTETARKMLREGHASATMWRFFVECVGYKMDFYDALIDFKRKHHIKADAALKPIEALTSSGSEKEVK